MNLRPMDLSNIENYVEIRTPGDPVATRLVLAPGARDPALKYRLMGNGFFEKGHYDTAIQFYSLSIGAEKTAAALANRAQAYLSMGNANMALLDAQAVLEMEPNHFKARFRLGRALLMKRRFTEAMAEFQKCLEQEKDNKQVKEAVEECKKAMNQQPPTVNVAEDLGPNFAFNQLLMRPWWPISSEKFTLESVDGSEQAMGTLQQLRVALSRNGVGVGPIAEIRLEQCQLNAHFIEFFQSLDARLLDGCTLELYGMRGSEHNFVTFLKLFKPISVHIASYEAYTWNVCAALQSVNAIRSAKHLMLFPRYCEGNRGGAGNGHMNFPKLTIPSVLRWLHQEERKYPPPGGQCPAWNPAPPAQSVALGLVFLGDVEACDELGSIWLSPVAKTLLFHGDSFGSGSNGVLQFIDECRKLFQEATHQLNYCVKVMVKKLESRKQKLLQIKPQHFSNALGEQLRVSVQNLTMELYMETDYFPPHQLVLIERFHSAPA